MLRSLLIAAAALAGTSASLAYAGSPGLIPIGEFEEHFEKIVPVAGTMLVGLRRGAAEGPLSVEALSIDIPKNAQGLVCLDMSTRDGHYTASQDFKLKDPTPGTVPLSLRSHHPEQLHGYADADLAVMAQMRADCDNGKPNAYLATRWRNGGGDNALVALVNVKLSRATAVLADASGHALTPSPTPCVQITSGSITAYDHVCRIDLAGVPAGSATHLTIETTAATGAKHAETYAVALIP